jgi:phosphomevalonate kinase
VLDFNCAAHGIDGACKFDQNTIASGLDNAAAVFGDLGVERFAAAGLERCESAFSSTPISRL